MTKEKQMIIYGHDYCGQARLLTGALEKSGLTYEYRDVIHGDAAWKRELKELARGNLSVPTVVFSDGTVMV